VSIITLKDNVEFDTESHRFTARYDNKTFKDSSYKGVIGLKNDYIKECQLSNLKKDELIKVYNLIDKDEYLYDPTEKKLYYETENGNLKIKRITHTDSLKEVYHKSDNKKASKRDLNKLAKLHDKIGYLEDDIKKTEEQLKSYGIEIEPWGSIVNIKYT